MEAKKIKKVFFAGEAPYYSEISEKLAKKGISSERYFAGIENSALSLNLFIFPQVLFKQKESNPEFFKNIPEKSVLVVLADPPVFFDDPSILCFLDLKSSADYWLYQITAAFERMESGLIIKNLAGIVADSENKLLEIQKISISLSTEKNIDKLLNIIISRCIQITGADAGTVYLIEEKDGEKNLRFMLNQNCSINLQSVSFTLPMDKKSIAGYVALTNQILNIPDSYEISKDVEYSHSKKFDQEYHYRTRSILSFPLTNHEDKVVGVIQLVNKRVHPKILLQKESDFQQWVIPFNQADEDFVHALSSQAAVALENAYLYKNLENLVVQRTAQLREANKELAEKNDLIAQDLKMAKQIQKNILPVDFKVIDRFNFAVYYDPMEEIGGDIYDIFQICPGHIRVFSADATGHGIQAALMTMLIKAEYEQIKTQMKTPADILTLYNQQMVQVYKKLQIFLPTVVLDINLNQKKIVYSSGSHPPFILINGGEVTSLEPTNRMIGLMDDEVYKNCEIDIKGPVKLVIYSDGLFEEFDAKEEQYGSERADELIARHKDLPVKQMVCYLLQDLDSFLNGVLKRDDLTIVAVETKD